MVFLQKGYFQYILIINWKTKKLRYCEREIIFADFPVPQLRSGDVVNVVMSCDENYAPYLSTAIYSSIKNNYIGDSFNFFILNAGISESTISRIEKYVISLGHSISFINVDLEKFISSCPLVDASKHITIAAYFRFSIARLLPSEIDKVLYLDVDTLIQDPLGDLFRLDIGDSYAGVVEDMYDYTDRVSESLKLKGKYFNSGVMLINLRKWRERKIEDLFFENTQKIYDKILFVDQDVINYTLDGNVVYLPLNWNVQQTAFHMD